MEWINEFEYFLINRWESNAYWITFTNDPQRQKEEILSYSLNRESYSNYSSNIFLIVVEMLRGMPSSGLEPETSPLPRELNHVN